MFLENPKSQYQQHYSNKQVQKSSMKYCSLIGPISEKLERRAIAGGSTHLTHYLAFEYNMTDHAWRLYDLSVNDLLLKHAWLDI